MDWFTTAHGVVDLFNRSPDAEFIFDDGADRWAALEWRDCEVPVSAFDMAPTLDEHLSALLPATTMAAEQERVQQIAQWMEQAGGVAKALCQSPILITLHNGKVRIEDGYHRLGVAVFCYGVQSVKALVAPQ